MDNEQVIKSKGIREVRSSNIGLYLWRLNTTGNYLADTEGRMLNIPARYGDISKMREIQKVAEYYGYGDGKAVFVESHRCTDEEYEEQVAELLAGRMPDVRMRSY